MKAIVNTTLVLKDHYIPDGVIVTDGDRIVKMGPRAAVDVSGIDTLDAGGLYTGPGLIEIHTHADGDHFFFEEPEKAAATLLYHGVTSTLAALYFNQTRDALIEQMKLIKGAMKNASNIIGFYMEAPYMNPKFGCDRENNPWNGPIDPEDYMPLIEEAGDLAKVWCVAPEREGIEKFVIDAKKKNPLAVFSVAHSEAQPYQIEKLIPLGLRLATHHTNATGTIHKYPECRGVCVDEAVWANREIYAEIISDKVGIHVDPYLQRLVRKIKGDDRVILISDSFVEHGPIPPGYDGADDINFDFSGEIAGTRIILDMAAQSFMKHTGASVCQAFGFTSGNPAALLSLGDRGELAVGKKADLAVVDHLFNVRHVFKDGKQIK
ncbi:MAG: amidohydrolase family protein [Clostridia bacterium]|nr:amidohydrolase family protein [Clostridia bacterium]